MLDLFAGAGTLGIEAASRGASCVTFVERSAVHARVLEQNAALLDGVSDHRVLSMDFRAALRLLRREKASFDLVFLDPPYGSELAEASLQELCCAGQELMSESSIVAVETERDRVLPAQVGDWSCSDRRIYGRSALGLYRRRGEVG